ncbi:MAG TPA: metalloregulator ArsR/SmtB family transcription factor [Patescibacteria group bacterium]|nr:metalloregulator ArsR/SmtB family transcription factor [Patescibacteria group bacterium]
MQEVKELEKLLKALANRRRLAIIRYLRKEKEATVSDIARVIRLSLKATSKHLVILVAVDILERDQRNLYMFYNLAPQQRSIVKYIISLL